jgi:hypothetical protein
MHEFIDTNSCAGMMGAFYNKGGGMKELIQWILQTAKTLAARVNCLDSEMQ